MDRMTISTRSRSETQHLFEKWAKLHRDYEFHAKKRCQARHWNTCGVCVTYQRGIVTLKKQLAEQMHEDAGYRS